MPSSPHCSGVHLASNTIRYASADRMAFGVFSKCTLLVCGPQDSATLRDRSSPSGLIFRGKRTGRQGVRAAPSDTAQSKGLVRSRQPAVGPGQCCVSPVMAAISETCTSAELEHFVAIANELADAAATVTVPYFRTPVDVEVKADSSPVTVADKEAEMAMRKILDHKLPEHSIFGEESGVTVGKGSDNRFCWVIDPIDGTKSFITGKPLFGTLIALLENGKPIVGIIDQPILKERWVGASGMTSTLNGKPISTRPCGKISRAYLYSTTPHMFEGESETAFNRVRDAVRIPMYGCDCYAYGLLSAGFCDIIVEADLKPYDYMALVPVIQGAGGHITDWQGNALELLICPETGELKQYAGEVVAAGDKAVHEMAVGLLDWK